MIETDYKKIKRGEPVLFKGKTIKYGRYLFNLCLPESFRLIDEPIDKNKLLSILDEIALYYSPKELIKTLDSIKKLGFDVSSKKGFSLSFLDLYSEKLTNIAKTFEDKGIRENLQFIKNDETINNLLKNMKFAEYVDSGARGSWDQAKQLVFMRSYVADADNKIKENLIRSNLINGLSEKEYFDSCWGARKGMMDTAMVTAKSGFLTRQLIYSTTNIELDENCEDCGTEDYIKIKVEKLDEKTGKVDNKKSIQFAKSLLWRYYIDNNNELKLIATKNYKNLVGKEIKLRSPILCKNKKICKKCYGNLYSILHSSQIGVIATQSVSERLTQSILRTFHTSGVVQQLTNKEEKSENKDVINGMQIANKIFHSAKDLEISKDPMALATTTQEIFGPNIHLVHYEILISSMMWVDNTPWRLLKNRDKVEYNWCSILKVPNKISWLLGSAFSNIKSKVLEGLVDGREDDISSLTALFRL